MKIAANIVGGLLGFVFVVLPALVLAGAMPQPPTPPAGSPEAMFNGAFMSTGYMTVVLVFEIFGGLLVAVPKTRNFGLLVLGPIIVNILSYHILIMKGEGLMGPPLVVAVFAAFLLWVGRRSFAGLVG